MLTDTYREIAYWAVLKDLEPAAEIPLTRLRDALPEFLAVAGDPQKEGRVLFDCLAGIAWDWPPWEPFARKTGRDSLKSVSTSLARLPPAEVLAGCSVAQLKALCSARNVRHEARATKQALVDAILRGTTAAAAAGEDFSRGQARLAQALEKCRAEMARNLALRILSVAHGLEEAERLADPDLRSVLPLREFHWGGETDMDAPKSCRRFDGKRLPAAAALASFPALPCDYLRCACWISAES